MNLKDFMEITSYRVTEGSDYLWSCYGDRAYSLDSQSMDEYSVSVVFDTKTQVVYEICAYDYQLNRAYRWMNPQFKEFHQREADERGVDADQAWDDVMFIDLDVEADFIEKATAIVNGVDYDTRVQIEVEFTDEELLAYMKLAHQMDITFNELVEQALSHAANIYRSSTETVDED